MDAIKTDLPVQCTTELPNAKLVFAALSVTAYVRTSLDNVQDVLDAITRMTASGAVKAPFQARVQPWMMECFGPMIAADRAERNHRFLEEALELVQACGCTEDEAHQLVAYVYGRAIGEIPQEVGGVMVTLAALCLAQGVDMHQAGDTELARIWTKVETIRAKNASKPRHSPLPEAGTAVAFCMGCGCDDLHACEGGCSWLRVDHARRQGVCSHCDDHVAAWDGLHIRESYYRRLAFHLGAVSPDAARAELTHGSDK